MMERLDYLEKEKIKNESPQICSPGTFFNRTRLLGDPTAPSNRNSVLTDDSGVFEDVLSKSESLDSDYFTDRKDPLISFASPAPHQRPSLSKNAETDSPEQLEACINPLFLMNSMSENPTLENTSSSSNFVESSSTDKTGSTKTVQCSSERHHDGGCRKEEQNEEQFQGWKNIEHQNLNAQHHLGNHRLKGNFGVPENSWKRRSGPGAYNGACNNEELTPTPLKKQVGSKSYSASVQSHSSSSSSCNKNRTVETKKRNSTPFLFADNHVKRPECRVKQNKSQYDTALRSFSSDLNDSLDGDNEASSSNKTQHNNNLNDNNNNNNSDHDINWSTLKASDVDGFYEDDPISTSFYSNSSYSVQSTTSNSTNSSYNRNKFKLSDDTNKQQTSKPKTTASDFKVDRRTTFKAVKQEKAHLYPKKYESENIPEHQIYVELHQLQEMLVELQMKGAHIEQVLRCIAKESGAKCRSEESILLGEWLELVRSKNIIIRRENELMHMLTQKELEEIQQAITSKLRPLMSKSQNEKSESEASEEERLLNNLLQVVEKRNSIVQTLEQDRLNEEMEDRKFEDLLNPEKLRDATTRQKTWRMVMSTFKNSKWANNLKSYYNYNSST